MNRPRVIIHNLTSLEGRPDGFPADIGLYYELAARLPHQAVLTGSNTILAAAASQGIEVADVPAQHRCRRLRHRLQHRPRPGRRETARPAPPTRLTSSASGGG